MSAIKPHSISFELPEDPYNDRTIRIWPSCDGIKGLLNVSVVTQYPLSSSESTFRLGLASWGNACKVDISRNANRHRGTRKLIRTNTFPSCLLTPNIDNAINSLRRSFNLRLDSVRRYTDRWDAITKNPPICLLDERHPWEKLFFTWKLFMISHHGLE